MTKSLLLLFFCLMIKIAACAQASSITGKIITTDGLPASFVPVQLKSLNKIVLSDEEGSFSFENLNSVTDSLIISSIEYQRKAIAVSVCCGNKLQAGNIFVQYSINALQDIEIKGKLTSSYKNDYSFFALKTQSNIKDVPQTVSVVSSELMKERMDYSLNDVVENIAGVNLFSDYEEYTIRGFRAENPRLINGLRTFNASLVSPLLANIERVEVIKGPSSVLYGDCDPGGVINMVTKKPLVEKINTLSANFGSWNDVRVSSDLTGPLNKDQSLLYRLNTAYRNNQSFRSQLFDKSFELAPSFSYTPNNKLALNIDLSLSHTNSVVDRGQPGINNNPDLISTPINLMVTQPGDYLRETDIASIITCTYKFNSNISINSSYLNYITQQQLSEHGFKQYITDDSAYLYYTNRNTHAVTNNITTYAVFNFKTEKIKHQFLIGYDFLLNSADNNEWNGELPDKFGEGSGVVGTFSLIHPQYFERPVNSYAHSTESSQGEDDDDDASYHSSGIYMQEQMTLKKWELLFSLRQEFYATSDDDDDQSAGNLDSLDDLKQNVLSPRIGITYKLTQNTSVYATWNTGFEPFEASANLPAFGGPFKPIKSRLYETGIKSDLFENRLYASLAVYQIKQTNVLVNANDPANPDKSVQAGSDASKGFEIEANGNVLPELSIDVSYAYNITKIVRGNNPAEVGKVEANAPKNISGSWLKYKFRKGVFNNVTVAVGHSQLSNRNTYTSLVLPGYIIFNSGIGYSCKRFNFQCNFNNITNKIYYNGGYNIINKWPGKPFNVMAEVSFQF